MTTPTDRGDSRRRARAALAAYDLPVTAVRLIAAHWNTTFRVDTATGDRYLLRLSRAALRDPDRLSAELEWLQALARDTDLLVPSVVRRRDGRTCAFDDVDGDGRLCAVFGWIDGRFQDRALRPVQLERVGRLTAALHQHAATYRPSPHARHLYGVDEKSWYAADPLSPESVARLAGVVDATFGSGGDLVTDFLQQVDAVRTRLGSGRDEFGLVHGDLHQENYLFTGGRAAAIDFDDCGLGHFAYDLGVTVSELGTRPGVDELRSALLRGYRQVGPLSAAAEASIDLFAELKRVQLMFWFIDRRHGSSADWWREDVGHVLDRVGRFLRR